MNKKKVVLIITSVILLLVALAGWCYWTAGHTIPMREYQKITERFKPYIVEEIEKSAEFGEAHLRAKLEMTAEEYEGLRKQLLAEGWGLYEGDVHGELQFLTEYEDGDRTESWMYRTHAEVFLDVFDNNIFVDMIALYHKDKVYIEYYDGVGINHTPFQKVECK